MACEAPFNPSPFARCIKVAISIVNSIKNAAGRVKRPRISNNPPSDSEMAAINPQKTGAKFIPTTLICEPRNSHVCIPPINLGNPCSKNMIPIPILNMSKPKFGADEINNLFFIIFLFGIILNNNQAISYSFNNLDEFFIKKWI